MTTLPHLNIPGMEESSPFGGVSDDSVPTPTKQRLDSAIRTSRAATPVAVVNQRATPRLSIDELNGSDWDTLREKLQAHPVHDDRPAIVKVLDTLDLPRNALWNILAPGIAARKKAAGETETFGLGAVHFSDVLDEMGVHNRIVKGILGFAGDLVTDPLLYLGGIGGVARLAGQGGKSVSLVRGFTKGVRAADEALAAGRGIDETTTIGRALKASGAHLEAQAALDSGADASGIASRHLLGDIRGSSITNRILGKSGAATLADRLSRVPRAGTHAEGGLIAEYFGREGLTDAAEAAKANAARDVVAEYGVQSAPGWKIGKGGTQVFHLPFTDFNVQIPAIGAEGARRVAQGAMATAGAGEVSRAVGPLVHGMDQLAGDVDAAYAAHIGSIDPAVQSDALNHADQAITQMRSLSKLSADAAQPISPNDLNAIGERMRQAESKADAIAASLPHVHDDFADITHRQMEANTRLAQAYRGSITQFINANAGTREAVDIAKRALGTDSDIMGASVLTPLKTVLEYAGLKDSSAYAYAQKTEKAIQSIFGLRNGRVSEVDRAYRNAVTSGGVERAKEVGIGLRDGLVGVLKDHGLDPAAHLDDAAHLATAFALKARADAGGANPVIWTTEFGSKDPAAFLQHIAEAQKSGMLSADATGKLGEDLAAFAKGQMLPVLDRMGTINAEGDLAANARDYFPYSTTSSAQDDIRNTLRQQLTKQGQAPLGKNPTPGLTRESFQKSKEASLEYRFFSKRPETAGQERRFFQSDLGWLDTDGAELERMRAGSPTEKAAAERIDDMREYFALPEADRPTPKYADPFAMNKMYQQGRFDILTGGRRRPEGFFDTNGVTVMASRVAAHERAVARATWAEYMGQHGVTVDGRKLQGTLGVDGKSIQMPDGSTARVSVRSFGGNEYRGVEYGGGFYRPLNAKAGALRDNPLLKGMGIDPEDTGRLFHEHVAEKIENAAAQVASDETTRELMKLTDNMLSMWKRWAVFRPGFLINNLVGDTMNSLMGGARVQDGMKHASNVIRMVMNSHDPAALKGIAFDVAGQKMTGEELWRVLEEKRVVETSQMSDVMANIIGHRWVALPSDIYGVNLIRTMTDPAEAARNLERDYRAVLQRFGAAAGMDKPGLLQHYRAADFLWDDRLSQWFLGPWARVNQKAANAQRAMTFLSHLEQGNDVAAATQKTIRSLFDYTDMTKVERSYGRRLFPFYSWMRNNGAYQMHLLVHRPIFAGAFPLVENALEEMIDGDARLPQHMRPNWMREQLALQLGSDPNHRVFYLPRSAVPVEQGVQMLEPLTGPAGLQDYLHSLVSSINPIPGKVFEYATGRETFSGRSINADPLLSEVSPGGFATDFLPPVAETKRIARATREQGVGAGVSRFLLGGRIHEGSDARLQRMNERDLKQTEESLRRTISRAEAEGDHKTSEAARLRLLQTYEQAQRGGLQIPKWARTQLSQIHPS